MTVSQIFTSDIACFNKFCYLCSEKKFTAMNLPSDKEKGSEPHGIDGVSDSPKEKRRKSFFKAVYNISLVVGLIALITAIAFCKTSSFEIPLYAVIVLWACVFVCLYAQGKIDEADGKFSSKHPFDSVI